MNEVFFDHQPKSKIDGHNATSKNSLEMDQKTKLFTLYCINPCHHHHSRFVVEIQYAPSLHERIARLFRTKFDNVLPCLTVVDFEQLSLVHFQGKIERKPFFFISFLPKGQWMIDTFYRQLKTTSHFHTHIHTC
jgi:hypothetical protein